MRTVSEAVLGVLERAQVDGKAVRLSGQLDRKLYIEVDKVLGALGGKWDRRARAHIFPSDPRTAMATVLAQGSYRDARRELDFFPTPRDLAAALVSIADLRAGDRILEPSAGDGRIAQAIRVAVPRARIQVCELNPDFQRLLAADGYDLIAEDFLALTPDGYTCDRIVMNPPFSKGQDVAHVLHAWSLLAPGGILVAVMSAGVSFRDDRATSAFRALIEAHGESEALPDGTFRESGTSVRTVRVLLSKPLRARTAPDTAMPTPSPCRPSREQLSLFS